MRPLTRVEDTGASKAHKTPSLPPAQQPFPQAGVHATRIGAQLSRCAATEPKLTTFSSVSPPWQCLLQHRPADPDPLDQPPFSTLRCKELTGSQPNQHVPLLFCQQRSEPETLARSS